ncbi:MAG: HAMP domain-containing histidine kinase [Planctomycetes bacterium]|nr:HAMP domain-containing histidine kinase [Planctomycetota bacterium]
MISDTFSKPKSTENMRRAPLLGILVAFLLVLAVCILGLWNDLTNRAKLLMASEVSNLQSHVERTIIRIEGELLEGKSIEDFSEPQLVPWLKDHWERMIDSQPNRLYASVEDASGVVVSRSRKFNLSNQGSVLHQNIPGFPQNVQKVIFEDDSSKSAAIEVALPISKNDLRVGVYRTAIPVTWLDKNTSNAAISRCFVWLAVLAAMSLIVSTTATYLFRLGTLTRDLEQALKTSETRRLADLSKFVVSIAHELRNPLNSVRLNLFTSEKLIRGESPIDQKEAIEMIHESVSEIERVNDLISQMLGLVKADDNQNVWLNLDEELQALLQFLKPTHEHHQIEVVYKSPARPVLARISKKYFRQVLINLLQNATQAMRNGGQIRLELEAGNNVAILKVDDSGPGIQQNLYEKIFEPFFSTRIEGAGLGLAVVKNLLDSAGAKIAIGPSQSLGGVSFTLEFQSIPIDVPTPVPSLIDLSKTQLETAS